MHLYANFLFCPAQFKADAPSMKPTKCLQTRLTLALPYSERDKQCSQCKLQTHIDVRGSVHHSTIHKEKSNKMQQYVKILIIPYLYEAQHVSGDTPFIIRSLKLHWQPLVFHT